MNIFRPRAGYGSFVSENPAFESYYKEQGIVAEKEWEQFNEAIHSSLPTTFRINARSQSVQWIREKLRQGFSEDIKHHVKPLSWYPDELAWELSFSRSQLRELPQLQRILEFLKLEHEVGNIARQEAVSMVPPLFLNMESHHHVLDMCAAPGSKTFQLLEVIHGEAEHEHESKGLVVANDFDVQRSHLLVHQMKRMSSPNIVVTKHDGQHFPGLTEFSRNPSIGNLYHGLQIQIAMRGVAHLRVGGRLVYSTCSLNPMEDEAVVAEILRQSEGTIELLDVSSELPSLKRRAGLNSWKVQGPTGWCTSYDGSSSVLPSMFPPGSKTEVPLERCMRFLPHDQDTGGFFIAVFEKLRPFKCMSRSMFERKRSTRAEAAPVGETEQRIPDAQKQDDPVLFLEDEETINNLVSYYGIQETLPLHGRLVVRSRDSSQVRRIYYVSESVSNVLKLNFQTGETLKITSAGVKVFERHSNKEYASACPFRIASEGLTLLLPHLSKQLLLASKEDFKLLLSSSLVQFASFHHTAFIRAVENLLVGCCVVSLKDSGSNEATAIACWRGRANMSLLVPRIEAEEILERLT